MRIPFGTGARGNHASPMRLHQPLVFLPLAIILTSFALPALAHERDLVGEERERMRPKCAEVVVNGVLADSFRSLEYLQSAENRDELVSRNPLQCGSHRCFGLTHVKGKRARVENWTQNFVYVTVPLMFENGPRRVYLWVEKSHISCPR